MTEWLNKRFAVDPADQDLSSVKEFSLYWNLFEYTVCGNNFKIPTLEQSFQTKNYSTSIE
jgi:hypothetical protein